MNDLPFLCSFAFLALIFWALIIHPQNVREEIAIKALETYQLVLKARIPAKDSQAAKLLRELGRDTETGQK